MCILKLQDEDLIVLTLSGLPQSGKNIWKMRSGKSQGIFRMARKDLESQGKVREFENKLLWQAVLRNFFCKDVHSHEIV